MANTDLSAYKGMYGVGWNAQMSPLPSLSFHSPLCSAAALLCNACIPSSCGTPARASWSCIRKRGEHGLGSVLGMSVTSSHAKPSSAHVPCPAGGGTDSPRQPASQDSLGSEPRVQEASSQTVTSDALPEVQSATGQRSEAVLILVWQAVLQL